MKKNYILILAVVLVIGGVFGGWSQSVNAQTAGNKFKIGDGVKVTGDYLQVRPLASLSGMAQGFRRIGDLGKIVDGPRSSNNYKWWKVDYDTGVDGWSAENWLEAVGSGGIAPPTSTVLTRFSKGDNVRVPGEGSYGLGVRSVASVPSTLLAIKNSGDFGVVTDGPVETEGYNWWKIKWSDEVEGWSVEFAWKGEQEIISPGRSYGMRFYLEKCPVGGCGTAISTSNQLPVISSVTGPMALNVGQSGTWAVSASDVDGSTLSYGATWGDGTTSPAQSGSSFAHTYSAVGTYTARFMVNDSRGGGISKSLIIAVAPSGVALSTEFAIGDRVRVAVNSLGVRTKEGLGSALSGSGIKNIGDTGVIIGGPRYADSYWWWNIDYDTAPDGWSAEAAKDNSQVYLEKIGSGSGNSAPVISGVSGPTSLKPNQSGTWIVSASDPDRDTLSYSVTWHGDYYNEPQIGSSFTYTYSTAGTYTATFRVIDSRGGFASKTVTIVVSNKFVVGDKIRVTAPNVQVRNIFDTAFPLLGMKNTGDIGAIIGGPRFNTNFGNQAIVWQVDYDTAPDGWSAENWLEKTGSGGTITNRPPIISDVTSPASLFADVPATWIVSASDSNADALLYSATWGDGTTSPAQSESSFRHTYAVTGNYTATFIVSDGRGESVSKTIVVAVTTLTASTKFVVGDRVRASGYHSNGVTSGDIGTVILGPEFSDTHFWLWRVNYDRGLDVWTDENWLTKTASAVPNNAPTISIVGPNSITNSAGTGSWTISAFDVDGDALTYGVVWGDGTTSAAQSGSSFIHSFPRSGNYGAVFTVTDSKGKSSSMTLSVSVTGMTTTSTSTPTPPTTKFIVGNRIWVTALSVRVKDNPTGAIVGIKNTGNPGTVIGGPKFADTYWWWQVDYDVVPDGWSAENWLEKIDPPVISGVTSPASLGVGTSGTWTVSASDPNSDTLSYSVTWGDGTSSGLQSGSSFTHTYSAVGTFTATFTVSDGKGGSASKAVTVTPAVSTKFIVGSKIRVTAPSVQVRSSPEQTATWLMKWKNTGDTGTVVGGPKFYDTYWWWQIDYANTDDGWSAENWLEKVPGSAWMQESSPTTYTASAIQAIQFQLSQIAAQLQALLEQLR